MELVTSGYIAGTEAPFSLFATGDTFISEAEGQTVITELSTGPLLNSTSGTMGDNSIYANVPSLWKGTVEGAPDVAKIAMAGDLGVGIGVNDFNGVYGAITAGSHFPVNAYARVHAPDMGALYVAAKPNARDVAITFQQYTHESGERFRMAWGTYNAGWFFFSKFGACYFFLNNPGKLGYIMPGSLQYNHIGDLAALTMYSMQAAISTARGVIYDPSGTPAPDCRVLAFNRATDRLVGRAVSGHDGSYTMHLQAYKGETIYMVCLDNVEQPDFEAQIIDRIIV